MRALPLRGITWQHRRAIDPLVQTLPAFAERHPQIEVSWDARPLHGFEFEPVHQLAERYDLIVLDHPFAGEIAARRSLLPLDGLVDARFAHAFVGPSLQSYHRDGHYWALPLDAACQVAVYRPDLLARLGADIPRDWADVLRLGARARRVGLDLAIGVQGVHSLMTFFTLCASLGHPCGTEPEQPFVEGSVASEALAALRALVDCCPRPAVYEWNSIALHDAMVARDDLVCCPAVYCYAAYAEPDLRRPLRFADLPGLGVASPAGSTIGGTGIGVSASTAQPEAAMTYVRYLLEASTQLAFAAHHGQPARVEAWSDPAVNARFGNCFHATRATMEQSWTRPRYDGYLRFQRLGGTLVEQHLRGNLPEKALIERLARLHASAGATD